MNRFSLSRGVVAAAAVLAAAGPADAIVVTGLNGNTCLPGGTVGPGARPCVLATKAGSGGTPEYPDFFELDLDLFAAGLAEVDAKGSILQRITGTGTLSPWNPKTGDIGPPAILLTFTGQIDVISGTETVARLSASTARGDTVEFVSEEFDFGSLSLRRLDVDYSLVGPAGVGANGLLTPTEFTTAEGSFTTDASPARFAVPVPAAAPAAGAGLFGLAALVRRRLSGRSAA